MHAVMGYLKALVFAAVLLIVAYLLRNYTIHTVADDATFMEPSVRRRAIKIFRTDGAMPARGAIVWFESPAIPGHMLISRVVGLPGDRIALDDGRLARDGAIVPEDYALERVAREDLPEILVPEDHVYVLNDARGQAWSAFRDSRRLGPVPLAAVVGVIGDPVVERELAGGRRAGRVDR